MNLARRYYEELYFNSNDDRDLLQHNQDAIVDLLDKNGAVGVFGLYEDEGYPIYFASGFAMTALGYSFDDMLKISDGKFVRLIYEKDRQGFLDHMVEHDSGSCEFRMVNANGKNIWVNFFCKKSTSKEDKPILVASIRVVDDAVKRESELLDALTKGYKRIIYVDVNQGRYRVIKSEDNVFDEQVCGTIHELREMLERYSKDYINPEDYSFAEILNKLNFFANPGEKGGNFQTTYLAKVGDNYQWMEFQAFYGGAMNLDTGHFILTFRDVDEEKKRELDANRIMSDSLARAQEAGRAKHQFLSRMSHDLRTPINGIIGMLEIAEKNRNDSKVMDECLEKIARSCDNLMSLVQDVLDMNNLENGKVELAEENVNLHSLLRDEFAGFSVKAKRAGFTYTEDLEDFAHPNIVGSPKHIVQIFDYVLDNAIKYNKPNGSISICAREAAKENATGMYEFEIEDTGIGMAPEFLNRIFEPFEQEHGEARTNYMGTGLGMSIVKTLVDEMNGTIEVDSKRGEGTKVHLTLPFKVADVIAPIAEDIENVDFTGVKVLLVEDNEVNMEIAQFLLESEGMVVTCATNGQEAVDAFGASEVGEFQIVLMDIMMPVMDGLEAAKMIRNMNRPDAGTVHIIALSANVMDTDIKKTRMAGMDEHLPKPINTGQLFQSIAKCLH